MQVECAYFLSEANNCKLYKVAILTNVLSNTTLDTNAGICPKSDKTRGYPEFDDSTVPSYPPEIPVPGKHSWCGEETDSICTFPFFLNNLTGSNLHYEPYKDASGELRCGTQNDYYPIDYYTTYNLSTAIQCSGK